MVCLCEPPTMRRYSQVERIFTLRSIPTLFETALRTFCLQPCSYLMGLRYDHGDDLALELASRFPSIQAGRRCLSTHKLWIVKLRIVMTCGLPLLLRFTSCRPFQLSLTTTAACENVTSPSALKRKSRKSTLTASGDTSTPTCGPEASHAA